MNEFYLKDLIEIKNGRDHKHLEDGKIPVFGSGGLMRFANKSLYNDESILLPRKGSLTNIQFTNKPFWTVDTLYYTIVNKQKANPFYLFNYLKRMDLSKLNSGTGVPSMTFGAYYGIKISLPNLETQQKIAVVLSALDEKIELNNQVNAQLEQMAKTIYDYWFVQFDFPDENGRPYKSSGGKMVFNDILKRKIPVGWEVKDFGEIFQISRGTLVTKDTSTNGNYKVVAAGINYSYLHGEYNRDKFTITVSGSGANAGFVNFWTEKIFASDCTTVRGKTDGETFLGLQFLKLFQNHIYSQAKGSAQPHVYPSDIQCLKYLKSNTNLEEKAGELLHSYFEKIGNNLKQNQELAQLRDWLLPMLMNGQVSVGSGEYKREEGGLEMVAEGNGEFKKLHL